jgi:hypothetical protein
MANPAIYFFFGAELVANLIRLRNNKMIKRKKIGKNTRFGTER